MKRRLVFCLLVCLAPIVCAHADDAPVNGYLHEIDGQRVLHVWGTHYEMGYAHGALLGDEIVAMMNEYVLELVPPFLYEAALVLVPLLFTMPQDYRDEVAGMIDGMAASGAETYIAPLGRHINANDLLMCNAIGDIGAMACSCQMAWGAGTEPDAALAGEVAVVRNLDWTMTGDDRFLLPRSTLVIVYTPTEGDKQPVAMVSFPGFFGCLSCMNEAGVTAVVNIAHNGVPLWEFDWIDRYTPMGATLREALHDPDFNGDGAGDLYDVVDDIDLNHPSGAIVINLAQPADWGGNPALIVETDSAGMTLRTTADAPEFFNHVLLSTNTLMKLRSHHTCRRYETMCEEITARGGRLTLAEMWLIEEAVMQDYFLSSTVQTMYFLPHTREMGVAFSSEEAFSAEKQPVALGWDEITALPPGTDLDDDQDTD
ncbi:MAG: hypothetical protein ACTSXZ_03090, partial [Alphaproteobacteria bacterium]